jgi:hypothetical protein
VICSKKELFLLFENKFASGTQLVDFGSEIVDVDFSWSTSDQASALSFQQHNDQVVRHVNYLPSLGGIELRLRAGHWKNNCYFHMLKVFLIL